MDIYSILASKPHNPHYLNRYWKFIQSCQVANQNLSKDTYTEKHHICPKAKDLFPEYKDFKKNDWNKVVLTARQHIISHLLLWKTYGGSQTTALCYFLSVQNSDTIKNNKRIVFSHIKTRYLAKAKEEYIINRLGYATYIDKTTGSRYFLHKFDPIIKELELVGTRTGSKNSKEVIDRISHTMYLKRKVTLFFLDCKKNVNLLSEEYCNLLDQGWTTKLLDEDFDYIFRQGRKKFSKVMKGRKQYSLPSGEYFGCLYEDDTLIKELDLIYYTTEKRDIQRINVFIPAGNKALTGSTVYTNGIDEIKLQPNDIIPEGYYLGRRPRTEEHSKKQKAATVAACKGTNTYNDGVKNYQVRSGDEIPSHWVKGMKPQKERNSFLVTDGLVYRKIRKGELIPDNFSKTNSKIFHKSELENIEYYHKEFTPGVRKRTQKPNTVNVKTKSAKDKIMIKKQLSKEHRESLLEANTNVTYYNNGVEVKKFKEHPGEGWVVGSLVSDNVKNKRRNATIEKCLGSITYNDGVRNYTVKPGDVIEPHWVKGMKPQKERNEIFYTDGENYFRYLKTEDQPIGLKKIPKKEVPTDILKKLI